MNLQQKRPTGVALITLAFLWIGIGGALVFSLLIVTGGAKDLCRLALGPITHSGSASTTASRAFDIALYVIYLACAVIGFGLQKLKNWARKCVLAISVIGVIGALAVAFLVKISIVLRVSIFGLALTVFGWMYWYLLTPGVLDAFGAWTRYTPDFQWIQPPTLSKRQRLGMSMLFTSAFIVLFALPLAVGVENEMKSSDAYKLTMSTAQASPCVSRRVGLPLEPGWIVPGDVRASLTKGSANLSIPVEGPKGKGTLDSRVDKLNGRWIIESLVFKYGSSRSIIVPARSSGDCR